MKLQGTQAQAELARGLTRYYRAHSLIYDATRWSFLFGRGELTDLISQQSGLNSILEVGCGTGKNLLDLRQGLPETQLCGVDVSGAMLAVSHKRLDKLSVPVQLHCGLYDANFKPQTPPDLILFSYALSMFNPGWEQAIEDAYQQLAPGGVIAVVDFHGSRFGLFRRWMQVNHVRMQRHLLPQLQQRFSEQHCRVKNAYGGLWQYFLFTGIKLGR